MGNTSASIGNASRKSVANSFMKELLQVQLAPVTLVLPSRESQLGFQVGEKSLEGLYWCRDAHIRVV